MSVKFAGTTRGRPRVERNAVQLRQDLRAEQQKALFYAATGDRSNLPPRSRPFAGQLSDRERRERVLRLHAPKLVHAEVVGLVDPSNPAQSGLRWRLCAAPQETLEVQRLLS